ncbi:MAG: hypothetical protein QM811_20110 [Pirellulales bacterium]
MLTMTAAMLAAMVALSAAVQQLMTAAVANAAAVVAVALAARSAAAENAAAPTMPPGPLWAEQPIVASSDKAKKAEVKSFITVRPFAGETGRDGPRRERDFAANDPMSRGTARWVEVES